MVRLILCGIILVFIIPVVFIDVIVAFGAAHRGHLHVEVGLAIKDYHRDIQTIKRVISTSRGRKESNQRQCQNRKEKVELFHRCTPLTYIYRQPKSAVTIVMRQGCINFTANGRCGN